MIVIFSSLVATAAFQLSSTPVSQSTQGQPVAQPSAYGPSIAIVEDLTDAVDPCSEIILCENWVMCTDECVLFEDQQTCYEDCNVAHSDSVIECQITDVNTCSACSEQCVDVCMADG